MGNPTLTIDLSAIGDNWRALNALSADSVTTSAVVKANAYGHGISAVAQHLWQIGVRQFFVAMPDEGAALRQILGPEPQINLFAGHMAGDSNLIAANTLTPVINSPQQWARHQQNLPGHAFGIQLDTGMSRLGMTPQSWADCRDTILAAGPQLIMSHLACADEPAHAMNPKQLGVFHGLTDGLTIPRSLAATGGILLGPDYHFDLTRPGIGLYGAEPFTAGTPATTLSIPIIQTRTLNAGDSVGYGNAWIAKDKTRVATIAAGYADGLHRALGNGTTFYHGTTPCPLIGRVSMDLITVDISHLADTPDSLDILCPSQTVDQLATAAGTIGYELLTSLGPRYERRYKGGQ